MAFTGHFVNAANPTFVLDSSNVPLTPTAQADVREPISSSCIATPFNGDGAACQGGAIGTPFFLYTNGTAPRALFAQAYDVDVPTTGLAVGRDDDDGHALGRGESRGRPRQGLVPVRDDHGLRADHGSDRVAPANAPVPFQAPLTSLPPSTTFHYRAVASTDFGVSWVRPDPDNGVRPAAAATTARRPKPPAIRLKITTTRSASSSGPARSRSPPRSARPAPCAPRPRSR